MLTVYYYTKIVKEILYRGANLSLDLLHIYIYAIIIVITQIPVKIEYYLFFYFLQVLDSIAYIYYYG